MSPKKAQKLTPFNVYIRWRPLPAEEGATEIQKAQSPETVVIPFHSLNLIPAARAPAEAPALGPALPLFPKSSRRTTTTGASTKM
ncbi:hypothetical protein TWF481_003031 [Arthrobotrys musiformis]|uniref:Uncharacterized protein n=1 Tax=Arthrobotrys musiformis TaxID=47236 RepID=A0AAV9VTX2_9PEZI